MYVHTENGIVRSTSIYVTRPQFNQRERKLLADREPAVLCEAVLVERDRAMEMILKDVHQHH